VAGTRAEVTSMLEAVPSGTSPGTIRTPATRRRKLERRPPTSWGYMICLETYGSGARIGMETTPVRRRQIRTTVQLVPAGWFVAVAGAAVRLTYGWLIAATSRPLARAAASGSVLQGRCPDLHFSFFTFLPFAAASSAGHGVARKREETQEIPEVLWPSG